MNAMTPLRLAAPLSLTPGPGAAWCLQGAGTPATRLYLRGFEPPPDLADCRVVTVDWPPGGGARITCTGRAGSLTVPAASAFVHSSCDGLYAALPLARFDARQQRFWRRVFLLVRLPGARRILHWVAERAR